MCFADFKKACDSVSHDKLWVTMMDMGYPLHLTDLIVSLKYISRYSIALLSIIHVHNNVVINGYWYQTAGIRTVWRDVPNLRSRDVTEPAKIRIRRIRILYFKSVGFRFVTQSQLTG